MHEPEMTPFERQLAGRLRAHSAIEVPSSNALAHARQAMTTPRGSRFGGAWASLASPMRAAIVVALLGAAFVGAVLVGAQLLQNRPTVVLPEPSRPAPSELAVLPAGEDMRARWLANVGSIPGIGNGSGPVTLTIDPTGGVLSIANLAPGASFVSRVTTIGDRLHLQLISDGAGCIAGALGEYVQTQSNDGSQLTLALVADVCPTRSATVARTWDRTLVGSTTVGAGIVDAFDPPFAITLPNARYEARVLDDWIEIGDPVSGFSLMVFKNPQGFVDACSQDEVRYPYAPGAAAFVAYYRQNDAFTVVEATPLTIDGHSAIHLVTKVRVEGARCPGAELYALTPRACNCHFLGGDDSLYLVDVGPDTFLFQLSPTTDAATELPIINTIRIPYEPGAASP
jgi:hypothetical protein